MRGQIFPEKWAMPCKLQFDSLIWPALDIKSRLFHFHFFPAAFGLILQWIGGIERLDVQVLLVHAENRPAKTNALVVPALDSRRSGLRRADDVPARRDQMHDVAKRRHDVHGAVRVIRENRAASGS